MERVAITGMGLVSPFGTGVAAFRAGLLAGRPVRERLTFPDADRLLIPYGAPVPDFDAEAHFDAGTLARTDRFSQFALVAGAEALAMAGGGALPPGAGAIIGTAGAGLSTADAAFRAVYDEGRARVSPWTVPRLMAGAAAAQLSLAHGLTGPSFAVSSACASGNHALALAAQMVRSGAAPLMLAGGADAMLTFGGIKAWEGLRVLSPDFCRPFAPDRNGFVMAEGAGVFVLEPLSAARARGATVLAEIAGAALTADAHDLTAPSAGGALAAMRAALRDAGISPGAVDLISAHGTATRANDLVEAEAIAALFGPGPLVMATKSLHGHAMGASPAFEAAAAILALTEGLVPATAGVPAPALDCPIRLAARTQTGADIRTCLSPAFAFGGLSATLVLTRPS